MHDRWNEDTRALNRLKRVNFDYFGVIASEELSGNTLIAFDENWIVPVIANYIKGENTYQTERTEALRELIAAKVTKGEWTNEPQLVSTSTLSVDQLRLYPLYDFDVSQKQLYLVFAPVSLEEAEKILLYTYRDGRLYNYSSYQVIRDLPLAEAEDLEYLNPVTLDFVGNYLVVRSEQLTQEQLDSIVLFEEYPFTFHRLDCLKGAYATFLLAESLHYQFSLRWENQTLYVGLCGWIQAQDISQHFARILSDIDRERVKFRLLFGFNEAVRIAETGSKCFYTNGEYYAATCSDCELPQVSNEPVQFDPSAAEAGHPFEHLEYLRLLGYRTETDPEPYHNDIQVGWITYQTDGRTFTRYYYTSTRGANLDLWEAPGERDEAVRTQLQERLQRGDFFDRKQRNLTSGYPEFIPSSPPNLSELKLS